MTMCMVCLERQMDSWKAGDINELMLEGRTIQQCLRQCGPARTDNQHLAPSFSKLMLEG